MTLPRQRPYVLHVPTDSNRAWQHPWLRVSLLLRTMLGTRWDAEAWPQVKTEFKKALALRGRIERAGGSIEGMQVATIADGVDRTEGLGGIRKGANSFLTTSVARR